MYLIARVPQAWATCACTLSMVPLFWDTVWWQGIGYSSFGAMLAPGMHLVGSWLWSVTAHSAPDGEQAAVNAYVK